MPRKRTQMKRIKDVLRLKIEVGLSLRDIAKCTQLGPATVSEILSRFKLSGLPWPLPEKLDDKALEAKLYQGKTTNRGKRLPDFTVLHQELKRTGMTKLLLWEEYCQQEPVTAYRYTQFCEHYQRWLKKQKRSMRQLHKAGDKLFIDFCGPTVPIINPDTGECRSAQIFVATLGATNYTYVEACESQKQESWLMAHANAFEFFGGVPKLLVPDNLKAAVTRADKHLPVLQENYARLARHYGTAIMPARPYKPKDKGKVENAVLVVERWILMRLRHQVFYTLAALNQEIKRLLDDLNNRQQRLHPGSRRELFDNIDKPALNPLPLHRYEYVDTRQAKVAPDYHVLYQKHAYSVPHQLVGERLTLEATARVVRIYYHGKQVSQHPRSHKDGGFTTLKEHMPQAHVKARWSPNRLLNWGANIGPGAREVVSRQLSSRPHPEQAIKTCLATLSLGQQYGNAKLEAACQQALLLERPHRQVILNLLKHPHMMTTPEPDETPVSHHNLRGQDYYQ